MQTHNPHIPIPDGLLARLAAPRSDILRSECTPATRALLAIALPEICSELLKWRDAARTKPIELALALRSQALESRLIEARATIQAASPQDPTPLASACDTLQRFSPCPTERAAAAQVLADMRDNCQADVQYVVRWAE